MSKLFYDEPQQVIFADPDNPGEWLAGIVYKDEIICGCCGGVFEISEVVENCEANKPIYEYIYWDDLSDTIIGGALPEGLTIKDHCIVESQYEQITFEDVEGDIEDEEAAWIEYFDSQFPQ